jgi:hypothetical protein
MQVKRIDLLMRLFLIIHFNSISKDSEEMSTFISIFIEEHGQPPAFNLFESCEQVAKRFVISVNYSNCFWSFCFRDDSEIETAIQLNELSYVLLIYLLKRNCLCLDKFVQDELLNDGAVQLEGL